MKYNIPSCNKMIVSILGAWQPFEIEDRLRMPSKMRTFGKIIRWKAGEIHRLQLNTVGGSVFTRLTVQSLTTD